MSGLLISPQSRKHLNALAKNPPHALLLVGPQGIGKHAVASEWAQQIAKNANTTTIMPDEKSTISIETIRGLYRLTRDKQLEWQIVIIDHAESMGLEAQNAFLKLLEEPRKGVTFILTAPTSDILLPTITSRAQLVSLSRLPQTSMLALAKQLKPQISSQELDQLLFIADGRPATLVRLISDEEEFSRAKSLMQQAKKLLTATSYERLSMLGDLAKSRDDAINVLEAMTRMLQAQLIRDPSPRWLKLAEDLQVCLSRLAQNGNPRAQLTALFANQ